MAQCSLNNIECNVSIFPSFKTFVFGEINKSSRTPETVLFGHKLFVSISYFI